MPPATEVSPKHLLKEGTPAELRDAIIDEDRPYFDRDFREALDTAGRTLSLDAVDKFLAHWRPRAAHQLHMGHDKWRALGEYGEYLNAYYQEHGHMPPGTVTHSEEEMAELLRAKMAAAAGR